MGQCCTSEQNQSSSELVTKIKIKQEVTYNTQLTQDQLDKLIILQAHVKGYCVRKKVQMPLTRSTKQKHSSSIEIQNQMGGSEYQKQTIRDREEFCISSSKKFYSQKSHIEDSSYKQSAQSVTSQRIIQLNSDVLSFIPQHVHEIQLVRNHVGKLQNIYMNNGGQYEGNWKNGMANGFGRYIFADKSFYNGDFVDNQANGYGTFQHINGDYYRGTWKNNKVDGTGKYTYADGTYYEGEWKDDLPHGYGTQILANGSTYVGMFKFGMKDGDGQLITNEYEFIGYFEKDSINGLGTMRCKDGSSYTGEWKDSKKSGQGLFTWPDGRKYEGGYLNDMRDGYGTYYWTSGQKYVGLWKEGYQHGNGTISKPNGFAIRGRWVKGKLVSSKNTHLSRQFTKQ